MPTVQPNKDCSGFDSERSSWPAGKLNRFTPPTQRTLWCCAASHRASNHLALATWSSSMNAIHAPRAAAIP